MEGWKERGFSSLKNNTGRERGRGGKKNVGKGNKKLVVKTILLWGLELKESLGDKGGRTIFV